MKLIRTAQVVIASSITVTLALSSTAAFAQPSLPEKRVAETTSATSVKIAKIGNKSVASSKSTAKLTPKVTAGKSVKILSKKLTVKKNGKTLAKGVSSFKAKKGTYKVTTAVKYKTKSKVKKVVTNGASNTKKIKMKCKVVSTETMYGYTVPGLEDWPLDLEYFSIECTGDAFDGKYKANAAYVYPDEISNFLGLEMIWGESFPSEPVFFPTVGKTFTITAVPKDGKLYKTTTKWSGEKTLKKTETIKVTVKK